MSGVPSAPVGAENTLHDIPLRLSQDQTDLLLSEMEEEIIAHNKNRTSCFSFRRHIMLLERRLASQGDYVRHQEIQLRDQLKTVQYQDIVIQELQVQLKSEKERRIAAESSLNVLFEESLDNSVVFDSIELDSPLGPVPKGPELESPDNEGDNILPSEGFRTRPEFTQRSDDEVEACEGLSVLSSPVRFNFKAEDRKRKSPWPNPEDVKRQK